MSKAFTFHTLLDARCSGCGQKKKCTHIGSTINNMQGKLVHETKDEG